MGWAGLEARYQGELDDGFSSFENNAILLLINVDCYQRRPVLILVRIFSGMQGFCARCRQVPTPLPVHFENYFTTCNDLSFRCLSCRKMQISFDRQIISEFAPPFSNDGICCTDKTFPMVCCANASCSLHSTVKAIARFCLFFLIWSLPLFAGPVVTIS